MNPPILTAATMGNLDEVNRLLAAGVNVNETNPEQSEQFTALMMAAREGYPEIIERLLEAGADVNQRNSRGRTALHEVFAFDDMPSERRVRTLKALLKADDIDLNAASNVGNTALDMLISRFRVHDIAALIVLLDAGIDVNRPYEDGSMPLENVLRDIEEIRGDRNMNANNNNNNNDISYLKQVASLLILYGASRPHVIRGLIPSGIRANQLKLRLANRAWRRRKNAVKSWYTVQKVMYPEDYENYAAPPAAGDQGTTATGGAGGAPAPPANNRGNDTGANRGGARRHSLKKQRRASTKRRRSTRRRD